MQVQPAPELDSFEQIFTRIWAEIAGRRPMPELRCLLRPFTRTLGRIRLQEGVLEVRIADILGGAPQTVKEALAWILLGKLFRQPAPPHYVRHWRQFLNRREVRKQLQVVQRVRGRKRFDPPAGAVYDLDSAFEALNLHYFGGMMQRPELGWSRGRARTMLGHYDPAHNVIVLSRLLDDERVPRLVVDYVLYHEMLHVAHPAEHHGSRRSVHTRDFRQAEKRFECLKDAKRLLRAVARGEI
jgi:hypothetical protein